MGQVGWHGPGAVKTHKNWVWAIGLRSMGQQAHRFLFFFFFFLFFRPKSVSFWLTFQPLHHFLLSSASRSLLSFCFFLLSFFFTSRSLLFWFLSLWPGQEKIWSLEAAAKEHGGAVMCTVMAAGQHGLGFFLLF
jgi:hypothetical protein